MSRFHPFSIAFTLAAIVSVTLGTASPARSVVLLNPYDYFLISKEHLDTATPLENSAGDEFSRALASGDFNGDGMMDLAIGAPNDVPLDDSNGSHSGCAYALSGSLGGPTRGNFDSSPGPSWLCQHDIPSSGDEVGDRFGQALAAGDFDGNGLDDLAVGLPGEAPGSDPPSGAVCVFPGTSSDGPKNGFSLTQETAGATNEDGDQFGFAMTAGDFNGDGREDLAVAVPYEDDDATEDGMVVVFYGSPTGLLPVTSYERISEASIGVVGEDGDRFGYSLAAGDFNGDGKDDLAVGAPYEDDVASNDGVVFVLFGSSAGLLPASLEQIRQSSVGATGESGDLFGYSLARADFNNDNYDDLAVGVPFENDIEVDDGMVVVMLGSSAGLLPASYQRIGQSWAGEPSERSDWFGTSLASGDMNGDGNDDLAVGAPGESPGTSPGSGAVYVFPGTSVGVGAGNGLDQQDFGAENEAGDDFGRSLAMGDFNGDDAADLAVGAPGEAPWADPACGVVFVTAGYRSVPVLTHGGVLGGVSHSGIRIWARADRAAQLRVQYKLPSQAWPGTTSPTTSLTSASDFTGVVLLSGLSSNTTYDYRLLLDGTVQAGSEATFRTLKPVAVPGTIRFAIGGDLQFRRHPFRIFDTIKDKDPDFMLFTGDQIYDNSPASLEVIPGVLPTIESFYERKYKENWGEAHMWSFLRSCPAFMILDDHEINDGWCSGQTGLYIDAMRAYDEYQDAINPPGSPSSVYYYSFKAGEIDFFITDPRTYRDCSDCVLPHSESLLGATQKAALKSWLSSSTGKFKFIMGMQWREYASCNRDKWHGFLNERNEIFQYIKDNHIGGVVLLSGDQHSGSVHRLNPFAPYYFYEFNATPLATLTSGGPIEPTGNPHTEDICQVNDDRLFGYFEMDTTVDPARLHFEMIDDDGDIRCSLDLTEDHVTTSVITLNPIGGSEPREYRLLPNQPNPFNPSTQIDFDMKEAGDVKLRVYDAQGRQVAVLVDERLPSGRHSTTFHAAGLPSGVYFCRLSVNGFTEVRKMALYR